MVSFSNLMSPIHHFDNKMEHCNGKLIHCHITIQHCDGTIANLNNATQNWDGKKKYCDFETQTFNIILDYTDVKSLLVISQLIITISKWSL